MKTPMVRKSMHQLNCRNMNTVYSNEVWEMNFIRISSKGYLKYACMSFHNTDENWIKT